MFEFLISCLFEMSLGLELYIFNVGFRDKAQATTHNIFLVVIDSNLFQTWHLVVKSDLSILDTYL